MRRLGSVVGAVVVLSAAMNAGIAGAMPTTWKLQVTPNPAGGTANVLNGVSCTEPNACTAVGSYLGSGGTTLTLAERWNGRRWEIQATPNPAGGTANVLNGVSCTEPNACTAVGSYVSSGGTTLTLAERWNGTNWTEQSTPNETGGLGSSAPNRLTAVSCTATTACTAVGNFTDIDVNGDVCPVALGWDGATWQEEPPACPGTNPQQMMGPNASFDGVSCTEPGACTAVGHFFSFGNELLLAERWDGTNWTLQGPPDPSSGTIVPEADSFSGVSCPRMHACAAVGSYLDVNGVFTLAEHWNGTAWEIQQTVDPDVVPVVANIFKGVSCIRPRLCTAVGTYNRNDGTGVTLAERLRITPTP